MAYDTKVILKALMRSVAKADSVKEAYEIIADAASAEDFTPLTYEEAVKKIKGE